MKLQILFIAPDQKLTTFQGLYLPPFSFGKGKRRESPEVSVPWRDGN